MEKRLPELLAKIDRLREKADAFGDLPPATRAALDQKTRLDWTYFSNKMEGNSLDYGETRLVLLKNLTVHGKPLADALHLKGHFIALDRLEKLIEKAEPLTETTIRDFHHLIFQDPFEAAPEAIKAGEWKDRNNYLYNNQGERVDFTPAGEETIRAMNALVNWVNNQFSEAKNYRKRKFRRADFDLHPLVVAAEFHRRFVEIHPFLDGNGRTARLFSNLVLLKFGFPPIIVRTENLDGYYAALELSKAADLEAFSVFMAERLIEAMEFFISVCEGGAVEEPEDWEKRLAILKYEAKKIKSDAPHFTPQLFLDRWNDSFKHLFIHLEKKLSKIDSLFIDSKCELILDSKLTFTIKNIEAFQKSNLDTILSSSKIDWIKEWYKLIVIQSDHKIYANVRIMINDYHYEVIGFNEEQIVLLKKWDQVCSSKEIEALVNSMAKSIIESIEDLKEDEDGLLF